MLTIGEQGKVIVDRSIIELALISHRLRNKSTLWGSDHTLRSFSNEGHQRPTRIPVAKWVSLSSRSGHNLSATIRAWSMRQHSSYPMLTSSIKC